MQADMIISIVILLPTTRCDGERRFRQQLIADDNSLVVTNILALLS